MEKRKFIEKHIENKSKTSWDMEPKLVQTLMNKKVQEETSPKFNKYRTTATLASNMLKARILNMYEETLVLLYYFDLSAALVLLKYYLLKISKSWDLRLCLFTNPTVGGFFMYVFFIFYRIFTESNLPKNWQTIYTDKYVFTMIKMYILFNFHKI